MEMYLDPEQREAFTISELARYILCKLKRINESQYSNWQRDSDGKFPVPVGSLLKAFLISNPRTGQRDADEPFHIKFSEAISLLMHRGLLMFNMDDAGTHIEKIRLTSLGEVSTFQDGILILVDDAQEIVNSLKQDFPNLDSVVEQYYLQSLRACQEGLYISSVICLGAASERAVHCLADAVVKHDPSYGSRIKSRRREVSRLIKYLADEIDRIFGSVADKQLIRELKEQLDLVAHIYRLNRNEAGHPKEVPDVERCTQETYLCSFHRYCRTIFKGVGVLNPNP